MNLRYVPNCKIQYTGQLVGRSEHGQQVPAIFPTEGHCTCTIQVDPVGATYSTAVITVKRGNDPRGPFYALETATTIAIGGGMTSAIDCSGFAFLALDVTTGDGNDKNVNVSVYFNDKAGSP